MLPDVLRQSHLIFQLTQDSCRNDISNPISVDFGRALCDPKIVVGLV